MVDVSGGREVVDRQKWPSSEKGLFWFFREEREERELKDGSFTSSEGVRFYFMTIR